MDSRRTASDLRAVNLVSRIVSGCVMGEANSEKIGMTGEAMSEAMSRKLLVMYEGGMMLLLSLRYSPHLGVNRHALEHGYQSLLFFGRWSPCD